MHVVEISYQSIVNYTYFDPMPLPLEDEDGDVAPVWTIDSTLSMDLFDIVLPYDEAILEAMTGVEISWDDLYNWSYFLPNLHEVGSNLSSSSFSGNFRNPLAQSHVYVKGNMSSISETIPVNISRNPNVIENISIGAKFSHEEIKIYTDIFKDFRDVFAWSSEEIP